MIVSKSVLKKGLLILVAAIVIVCCKEKKETAKEPIQQDSVESVVYDLEIEESNCANNKKDIAVLLFEDGFDGDLIDVYLNGDKVFSEKIYTDKSLGFAEEVELGKLSAITDLTIKINNSQKMDVLNKTCSFTFVNFIDGKATVKYDGIFVPYN